MPQQVRTKPTNSQKTSLTYKLEAHQQLSTQMAQEAHTIPGVSNLGHPPNQTDSQTHLIAMLYLLKLWRQHKLSCKPLQEEEVENLLPTLGVKFKTLSRSDMPLTLLSDELPDPLEGLEDLMDLEAPEGQENQRYPSITSSPSNQLES